MHLDFIALRLTPRGINPYENVNMRALVEQSAKEIRSVDASLESMIRDGRVGRVYVGLYNSSPGYGPMYLFFRHAPEVLRGVFPRLNSAGALDLLDVRDGTDFPLSTLMP